MYRSAITSLLEWKALSGSERLPMLIKGARQVGKTWLMREFGNYYDRVIYSNLEMDIDMRAAFLKNEDIRDPDDILHRIGQLAGGPLRGDGTELLILDELQTVPNGMSRLKYLPEVMPNLHIIAAGSLLGISWGKQMGYMGEPIGFYDELFLHPLNFQEFLNAIGEEKMSQALCECDWNTMHEYHEKYLEKMWLYFAVGGMPRSVSAFIARGLDAVRHSQRLMITQYANDFAKRMPPYDARNAEALWNKIQTYIGKHDPKALFGRLRHEQNLPHEEKLRDFVQWFSDAGLIHRLWRIGQPRHGFAGYRVADEIKAYSLDIGLLGAMLGISIEALVSDKKFQGNHLGTLAEQFVMQELVASGKSQSIGYWQKPLKDPDSGKEKPCEIDFLLDECLEAVPIEVKSTNDFTSKSLNLFRAVFSEISHAVRISTKNFGTDGKLWSLPLYATSTISTFLKQHSMPWNEEDSKKQENNKNEEDDDESSCPKP